MLLLHAGLGWVAPPPAAASTSASVAAPASPGAVQAELPPPCTMVFAQGRNYVAELPASNARWDELNQQFAQLLAQHLTQAQQRNAVMVLKVDAQQRQANLATMMQRATEQGCTRVLDVSVFGDPATQQLIVRVRLHPLVSTEAGVGIGEAQLTEQRELTLNARSLSRLTSGEISGQLAAEVIARLKP